MTGVLTVDRPAQPTAPTRYTVALARNEEDVRAAQRLRHDVFAGELGALLPSPQPGLDIDAFDAYCDHLLVREETTGQVVGTYRLLPPERAAVAGRLYSESEFDLTSPRRDPAGARRGRPLLCAPRPPRRRGHQPHLGRYRPLHGRTRPRVARRLLLHPAGRRRRSRLRHLGPGERQAPVAAGVPRPAAAAVDRRAPRPPPASNCPPCCAATCASAPGCAANRPTTRTSASPTCTCCCR